MAPQYSSDRSSAVAFVAAVGDVSRQFNPLAVSSCLAELRVLSQTSFISSRQSINRKAEKATFPKDGFKEVSTCIGLISSGIESSLPGESRGGGALYNLDSGSTFECFLPGR